MKIKLLSSLEKLLGGEEPNLPELKNHTMFKNEPFSFQVACFPEEKDRTIFYRCRVRRSALKKDVKIYRVEDVPSGLSVPENADDFYLENRSEYPDLLEEIGNDPFELEEGKWTVLWIQYTPTEYAPGKKLLTVEFFYKGKIFGERTVTLRILDQELPKQKLLYTNWLHSDCLCTWYHVEPFSEAYWEIFEKYVKNAVAHGMNMILTPVFTPPLDTRVGRERPTVQLFEVAKDGKQYIFGVRHFERFVSICLSAGIEAFEISHLFTQWGAKAAPKIMEKNFGRDRQLFGWGTDPFGNRYKHFLIQFAAALRTEAEKLGISDRIFIHVSDEPSPEDFDNYRKASSFLHMLFPDFRFIDAVSDYEYYDAGFVKTPVPSVGKIDTFAKHVDKVWTYYCCAQSNDYLPNRFFAMPSLRNRILGFLLYKYNAEGFLHWGYNFWYSQYSVYKLNPFYETDAGGAFPSGDAFVVYPGVDGKPVNSIRIKVFYEGICDLRALKLLESLTSREYALSVLEEGLTEPLSFTTYPHENEWLLNTRQRIYSEIMKNKS